MEVLKDQYAIENSKLINIIPNYLNKNLNTEYRNFSDRKLKPISLGAHIPNGLLTDMENNQREFSDILNGKPAIISFFRGTWCKYCGMELNAYEQVIKEVGEDIPIILISPDSPEELIDAIPDQMAKVNVFWDSNNNLAKDFNLVMKTPGYMNLLYKLGGLDIKKRQKSNNASLPIPATYVVNEMGIITNAWIDPDYTHRAEPLEVLEAYKEVLLMSEMK